MRLKQAHVPSQQLEAKKTHGSGNEIRDSAHFAMLAVALVAGCGKKVDTISEAVKKDIAAGFPAPGLADARAIAKEGFIHVLPIAMNHGVMYEYIIDRNSGQFKAPSGTIHKVHRVFTHEHTASLIPNSDTPHSLIRITLRAEVMVIPVRAVDNKRYQSAMLNGGNTFNFGDIGSRATQGNRMNRPLATGCRGGVPVQAQARRMMRSVFASSTSAWVPSAALPWARTAARTRSAASLSAMPASRRCTGMRRLR